MGHVYLFNGGLSKILAPHLLQVNEARELINVDTRQGAAVAFKEDKESELRLVHTDHDTMTLYNGELYTGEQVEFADLSGVLFRSSPGRAQKLFQGEWHILGIVAPDTKPNVIGGDGGVLSSKYNYCYTYFNIYDGTESAPSPVSDDITVSNKKIGLEFKSSGDPQVTHIKIYRLGGNKTEMSYVGMVINPRPTYIDNIADVDLTGDILDTYGNGPSPLGLRNFQVAYAMLWGTVGSKVHYSHIGNGNYWDAYDFIEMDDTVTGMGLTPNGMMVFTKDRAYIITGTDPSSFSKHLISTEFGCIDRRSIQYVNNNLVWAARDGICVSNGGLIQNITRNKVPLTLDRVFASVAFDGRYFLSAWETVYIVDMQEGVVISTLDDTYFGMYSDGYKLYAIKQGAIYEMFAGEEPREIVYKSARFSDGMISGIKNYKSVYVYVEGELEFVTLLDGKEHSRQTLVNGYNEIKLPQGERLAYHIQFEAKGKGNLLEIEYKAEGRQNGK